MNVQFKKTMPLSTARHVGVAAVLAYVLAVTGAHGRGFDEPRNERWLSDDVVLAQHADDCGCADDEGFDDDDEDFSDFDEFDQEMEDEFAEDIVDADDFGGDYANDNGIAAASGQGLTAEQERRLDETLNRVTGSVLGVRERAIDVQSQGSYDYYGPAQ